MILAPIRRLERWLRTALLPVALSAAAHAESELRVEVVNPRPFGYVIGDVLERAITAEVADRYVLERASLPRSGRLDAWLESWPPSIAASTWLGRTHYRIKLAYQIVGSSERVTTIALPEVRLVFTGDGASISETLPDWPITAGPLTPTHVLGRASLEEIRPDRAPARISTRPPAVRLALYATTAGLLLLYLGYRRFGLSWPGRPGPFARALRDVRSLALGEHGAPTHRTALRRVHRAFDETAGRTLFAGELSGFFESHPRFTGVRDAIERFFETSRQEFFDDGRAGDTNLTELVALCRECRRRERGGR